MSVADDPAEDQRLTRFYAERVAEQDERNPGYADAWQEFASAVLAHGGSHVVPPLRTDPLIDVLRVAGEVTEGPARFEPGEPSNCHRNAVAVWRTGAAPAIGTGYALSEDGLWREHSWAVADDGVVVETTEPRVRYFGLTLDGDRAEWFAEWVEGT